MLIGCHYTRKNGCCFSIFSEYSFVVLKNQILFLHVKRVHYHIFSSPNGLLPKIKGIFHLRPIFYLYILGLSHFQFGRVNLGMWPKLNFLDIILSCIFGVLTYKRSEASQVQVFTFLVRTQCLRASVRSIYLKTTTSLRSCDGHQIVANSKYIS